MIIGCDIGSRVDSTCLITLDDWRVIKAQWLDVPVEYSTVLATISHAAQQNYPVMIDASGVGEVVYSLLAESFPNLVAVKTTAGQQIKKNKSGWSIGKSSLVGALLQSLTREKLKVELPEPGRSRLLAELVDFRRYQSGHRAPKFEARPSRHDDAVMALALAVWGRVAQALPEY